MEIEISEMEAQQLARQENEKDLILEKMEELEKTNRMLNQKIWGLKSGISVGQAKRFVLRKNLRHQSL